MKPDEFNGETCIRLLLDKSQDTGLRDDAADSLMGYPEPQACQALLTVIHDESESPDLRETAAECLGNLWAGMEYDQNVLSSIPKRYKSALNRERELAIKTGPSQKNRGAQR